MSIYADLVCRQCKVSLWLGKRVEPEAGGVYFHRVSAGKANSTDTLLNRVLWKFLADHAGHPMEVVDERQPDYDAIADFDEIGSDEIGGTTFEAYVKDWPG